jgi:hypothetical protein
VQLPGDVSDLGRAGRDKWQAKVESVLSEAIADFGSEESRLRAEIAEERAVVGVEWTGFPERVSLCLGRRKTLELLDAAPGLPGGRAVQEEYMEWRVVREESRIRLIEMTTELPEYWTLLAAVAPQRLLELIAEFSGVTEVAADDVFGSDDVLDPGVSPTRRAEGFARRMLGRGTSPYNDGGRAICCMRQQSNTLMGLAQLAAAAATPHTIIDQLDGRTRALRCSESIPLLWFGVARLGRASDPLLVERLAQLSFEGRLIALAPPIGLYISNIELGRLRTPDGSPVPQEWFRYSRGVTGDDGRRRFQRLTFEVPPQETFCVSDLIDVATERRVEFGGEIADLISVSLFLCISERGAVAAPTQAVEQSNGVQFQEDCDELDQLYASFLNATR